MVIVLIATSYFSNFMHELLVSSPSLISRVGVVALPHRMRGSYLRFVALGPINISSDIWSTLAQHEAHAIRCWTGA